VPLRHNRRWRPQPPKHPDMACQHINSVQLNPLRSWCQTDSSLLAPPASRKQCTPAQAAHYLHHMQRRAMANSSVTNKNSLRYFVAAAARVMWTSHDAGLAHAAHMPRCNTQRRKASLAWDGCSDMQLRQSAPASTRGEGSQEPRAAALPPAHLQLVRSALRLVAARLRPSA
jgi:hypothetical protein